MKKLALSILIFLFLFGQVRAQETVIYLPVILKSGDSCMMNWAILEISDGTATVDLINSSRTGFHLRDWSPQVIQPKEGGVFQDSPIAPGRRLVYAVDATAIESLTVDVNDYDQDGLIEQAQDLMRLLLKARAYQSTEFQDGPVWIRARSDCETNDRFALIINWALPQLDNPYAPPFVSASVIALMDDLNLQLERGHWLALEPGQGECVEVSSQQTWDYGFTLTQVSTLPTASVTGFARHSGGNLYAVAFENRIIRSTDAGATWANNLTGAPLAAGDLLQTIYTLANDNILAGGFDGGGSALIRTTNNGGAWSDVSVAAMGTVTDIAQTGAGTVIATGLDTSGFIGIWRSTNNGAAWTQVLTGDSRRLTTIAIAESGKILAFGYDSSLYSSTDDGLTWSLGVVEPTKQVSRPFKAILASDGNLYLASSVSGSNMGQIWKSTDNGVTWQLHFTTNNIIFNLIETSVAGQFYANLDSNTTNYAMLWRSDDYGAGWENVATINTASGGSLGIRKGLFQNTDGRLLIGAQNFAGTAGFVFRSGVSATATLGQEATCEDEVFITNQLALNNLTHIFRDDGGVFSANLFPAFPVTLYPATPALDDALYLGTDTTVAHGGPFDNLIFDLSTTMSGSYALTAEYWNGAWVTLTTVDYTNSFAGPGVSSMVWARPSDWVTTTVNGVVGYWVRIRISSLSGTVIPPVQQARSIYTVKMPVFDVAQVGGDIPAIMQLKLANVSDRDGPGGSTPNLFSNRIVAGLRSGASNNFRSIINISNNEAITVSLGAGTTFASDVTAPTGSRATYNPTGVEAMDTRATVALNLTIARDFYGVFHAFLRARRTAGAATDISVRLQIATGSGGITFTTQSKQLQTTTAFEVLDFGEITLPVSGTFKSTDLGDITEIRIQASAASGTPDLYLYDLILIPVDEWAVDAVDFANEADSDVGRSNGIAKLLDVDSVTDPKVDIRTLVRITGTNGFITSEWNPITNGAAILQANTTQRLWFFAMQTSATGLSYSWLAPPGIAHSVQLFAVDRYLGQRGSR